jgi:hypothetical protein
MVAHAELKGKGRTRIVNPDLIRVCLFLIRFEIRRIPAQGRDDE